ncbi:type II toxin-antitoxin system VapC family toxin [Cellulomonas sp. PhB143]|uniref:type II toxin-antitoxin system VapC family toxin n=1 Tax=Cellulomonas sp. PhB143 TaxID=2485186 RepID=UPI000F47CC9C|nr:type II toxin-antitoxin system VapC family toxin [Cellulomonas sp. PhB143]ROS78857.1 PIN domain-containing protein [Cellulomonas sp. PhB143]
MALVYLDTSALVHLCVPGSGSRLTAALWNRADVVVTSRLADTEIRAVLAAGLRAGALEPAEHAAAVRTWEELWPALHVVELTASVAATAADLVARVPATLRGGDAVHVASALAVRHPETVVAAWDEHVAAAARSEGLVVVP